MPVVDELGKLIEFIVCRDLNLNKLKRNLGNY